MASYPMLLSGGAKEQTFAIPASTEQPRIMGSLVLKIHVGIILSSTGKTASTAAACCSSALVCARSHLKCTIDEISVRVLATRLVTDCYSLGISSCSQADQDSI